MNRIPQSVFEAVDQAFQDGASIRQVCQRFKIARETAHRIQKAGKLADLQCAGVTSINTGKNAEGQIVSYIIDFPLPWWRNKPQN